MSRRQASRGRCRITMSTVGGGGRGGRGRWWRCELIMTNDCLILFIFLPVSRFRLHSFRYPDSGYIPFLSIPGNIPVSILECPYSTGIYTPWNGNIGWPLCHF